MLVCFLCTAYGVDALNFVRTSAWKHSLWTSPLPTSAVFHDVTVAVEAEDIPPWTCCCLPSGCFSLLNKGMQFGIAADGECVCVPVPEALPHQHHGDARACSPCVALGFAAGEEGSESCSSLGMASRNPVLVLSGTGVPHPWQPQALAACRWLCWVV